MPRNTEARVQPFYEAANRFVSEALKSDGSLFTPGVPVWSADNIKELYHRFIEQPHPGPDRFEVKLRRQLQGAPAKAIQLAGEVLFVHLLRSEEHTSELQSPYDLVCRLLLEKKKKTQNTHKE